ncbi:MAG TPA: P1 family peptidase [Solirubrobacterales bacterium]|nr:P1 family peptidase [Solirubrobacterales bacterium]
MSDVEQSPPEGFAIGHWTAPSAPTGCTVVLPPAGTRAAVDVRGGGPGTRETDVIDPLANPEEATAVLLTGGSAHGLAAADGVVRWCEEQGRGYVTPAGLVPLVPAAVIYDLNADPGAPSVRPGPDAGYAACEAASPGVPERGRVGAGRGAAVAKVRGREAGAPGGVGYAAMRTGAGEAVAALAVVNATGDIVDERGELIAGPRDEDGKMGRSADLLAAGVAPPYEPPERASTTLACVLTDAGLDKVGCAKVARMASAGVARAVDPVFTPFDGDVVFCLAAGDPRPDPWQIVRLGTVAATLVAAAVRDGVRRAATS